MPRPHPPEFRQRAVELARVRDKPVAQIARDFGISDSCLWNWMAQADVNDGARPGFSSDEGAELVRLRGGKRVLEMEVEIVKRGSAYFARENIVPKIFAPSSSTGAPICRSKCVAARWMSPDRPFTRGGTLRRIRAAGCSTTPNSVTSSRTSRSSLSAVRAPGE